MSQQNKVYVSEPGEYFKSQTEKVTSQISLTDYFEEKTIEERDFSWHKTLLAFEKAADQIKSFIQRHNKWRMGDEEQKKAFEDVLEIVTYETKNLQEVFQKKLKTLEDSFDYKTAIKGSSLLNEQMIMSKKSYPYTSVVSVQGLLKNPTFLLDSELDPKVGGLNLEVLKNITLKKNSKIAFLDVFPGFHHYCIVVAKEENSKLVESLHLYQYEKNTSISKSNFILPEKAKVEYLDVIPNESDFKSIADTIIQYKLIPGENDTKLKRQIQYINLQSSKFKKFYSSSDFKDNHNKFFAIQNTLTLISSDELLMINISGSKQLVLSKALYRDAKGDWASKLTENAKSIPAKDLIKSTGIDGSLIIAKKLPTIIFFSCLNIQDCQPYVEINGTWEKYDRQSICSYYYLDIKNPHIYGEPSTNKELFNEVDFSKVIFHEKLKLVAVVGVEKSNDDPSHIVFAVFSYKGCRVVQKNNFFKERPLLVKTLKIAIQKEEKLSEVSVETFQHPSKCLIYISLLGTNRFFRFLASPVSDFKEKSERNGVQEMPFSLFSCSFDPYTMEMFRVNLELAQEPIIINNLKVAQPINSEPQTPSLICCLNGKFIAKITENSFLN